MTGVKEHCLVGFSLSAGNWIKNWLLSGLGHLLLGENGKVRE